MFLPNEKAVYSRGYKAGGQGSASQVALFPSPALILNVD